MYMVGEIVFSINLVCVCCACAPCALLLTFAEFCYFGFTTLTSTNIIALFLLPLNTSVT